MLAHTAPGLLPGGLASRQPGTEACFPVPRRDVS